MPIAPLNSTMKLVSCGPQANSAPGMISADNQPRHRVQHRRRRRLEACLDQLRRRVERHGAFRQPTLGDLPHPHRDAAAVVGERDERNRVRGRRGDAAGPRQGDRPARVRLVRADRNNDGADQQHHENEQQQR